MLLHSTPEFYGLSKRESFAVLFSKYMLALSPINLLKTNSCARPRTTWRPMLVPKFVNTTNAYTI